MGAPILVDAAENTNPIDIALTELDAGILPITIRRTLPDGTFQDIPLKWLALSLNFSLLFLQFLFCLIQCVADLFPVGSLPIDLPAVGAFPKLVIISKRVLFQFLF